MAKVRNKKSRQLAQLIIYFIINYLEFKVYFLFEGNGYVAIMLMDEQYLFWSLASQRSFIRCHGLP